MPTIFMQAEAFVRLEADLNALDPNLEFVLLQPDGGLTRGGEAITIQEARPDVAWFNVGLARAGQRAGGRRCEARDFIS